MPAESKNATLIDLFAGDSGAGVCCVVGSGPAGIACAKALLERGRRVHLLDGGITLESGRAALVERLKAGKPENWTQADLAAYQAGMNPDVGGVPLKLVCGSDFPYREANEHLGVHYFGVGLRPSLAQGGLSTAWGAAMLPYAEMDMQDWPLPLSALAPHYAAVLRFTGLAACQDDLTQLFPLYSSEPTELRPSAQAAMLLETMARHRDRLARAGICFGRSRLAVRGNDPSGSGGCIYCRLCMYGCPYGHIYSSADTLNELQRHPKFTYQPRVVVRSIRELPGKVEISGYDLQTRKPLLWHSRRAFLAAGTIATSGILLRSLEAYDQTAWLQDSQYFLIPLVFRRKVRGASRESLHALSQVFLEILDPSGHGITAHVQIYSNNDLINQAVTAVFGRLQRPLGFLLRDLQERLLVAQGFIHSRHSSRIAVCLKKDTATGRDRLELRSELNPAAREQVKRLVFKLCKHTRCIGAVPLLPMLKIAEPGRSFHAGGSFPMFPVPQGFQTDLLGRLPGWKQVHAVDATVFPSIPATTITLSVMANAHRIGWEAALEDP